MPDQQASPTRRNVLRGAAWATPVIAIGAAAPSAAASPAPGNLISNPMGYGSDNPSAGYEAFIPAVRYNGPYDGQDHEATDLVFVLTVPKSLFTGGPAVQGTGYQNYSWSATVAPDGDNWVYTVALSGDPITGSNTNAQISIGLPYDLAQKGSSFTGTFSATHDGGIPVEGTPMTIGNQLN